MDLLDTQVYELIGDEGFARLVAGFYRRVPDDGILGPLYKGRDLAAAEWRLREFLVGRFGGPERYIQQQGNPRLRMRHHPCKIDQAARDRWVLVMSGALKEAKLHSGAETMLRRFFEDSATF